MKFCNLCGGPVTLQIPEGDERERHVCQNCGHIHYINPKVIVGCLPTVGDRILMCKRAIEPRYGKWTLPAGFMENGETSAGGAGRETWEEAAAKAIDLELYRIFDVPHRCRPRVAGERALYRAGDPLGRAGVSHCQGTTQRVSRGSKNRAVPGSQYGD